MVIFQIILFVIGLYALLFFLIPKGNPINEALYLPVWWFKMIQLPSDNMLKSKYKYGKGFRQYLMLYEPKNQMEVGDISRRSNGESMGLPNPPLEQGNFPKSPKKNVIVYIHGGGWQFSRPEAFEPNAQEWVNKGYTVFMPTHRRIPFNDYDDMREDLNLILKKVREIMVEKGIGDYGMIIGGMSSGANLAALMSLDKAALHAVNLSQNHISGLFLLGAPLNLKLMRLSPVVYFFAGGQGSPKFKKANPIEYLNEKQDFPILGIHGTKDGFVEYESAVTFYDKLKENHHHSLEFRLLKNVTHLEVAGWSFLKNGVRDMLFDWMDRL